jgi:hypothetical protein
VAGGPVECTASVTSFVACNCHRLIRGLQERPDLRLMVFRGPTGHGSSNRMQTLVFCALLRVR